MADYSHQHAELQLKCGEESLFVVQLSVHEEVSRPFVATVTARSEKPDLELEHIVGFSAGLRASSRVDRVWTGVCKSIELARSTAKEDGVSTYVLEIVPNLWLLSQRRNQRVFQHLSAVEITEQLMAEWGIDFAMKTEEEHPKLEYRVQYGESDLAFLSRLLEEAGIAYSFETPPDAKKRVTQVVFREQPNAGVLGPYPYHDSPPDADVGHYVTKIQVGQASRSGQVTIRDWDWRRPDTERRAASQSTVSSEPEKSWEQYHFSPGGFLIDTEGGGETPVADDRSVARHVDPYGAWLADKTLVSAQYKRRFVHFETNMIHLSVGMRFSVGSAPNHPRADVADQELLVVECQTIGNASGELVVVGVAVFSQDPFRLPKRTRKPRIDGLQSALVMGPKGEEIHVDELGRVRVRFHWDREGEFDDSRSCWLRAAQGWAGPGYGGVMLPRVGHEVLVGFLDGDPDQPLIVGRLYNATAKQPYKLPDCKTHSGLKSQTSPFVDGHYNELFFDDQKDKELVALQGQRNLMKLVKNNETRRVGKERLEVVGEHRLGVVRSVDALHAGEQHLVQIVKAKDLKIPKQEDPKIKPRETWIEMVDEKITLTTGAASIVLDGPDVTIQADKGIRLSAAGDLKIKGSMVFLNCSSAATVSPEAGCQVSDEVRTLDDEDRAAVAVKALLALDADQQASKPLKRSWGFERRRTQRIQKKLDKQQRKKKAAQAAGRSDEPSGLDKWLADKFAKPAMPEHPFTADSEQKDEG